MYKYLYLWKSVKTCSQRRKHIRRNELKQWEKYNFTWNALDSFHLIRLSIVRIVTLLIIHALWIQPDKWNGSRAWEEQTHVQQIQHITYILLTFCGICCHWTRVSCQIIKNLFSAVLAFWVAGAKQFVFNIGGRVTFLYRWQTFNKMKRWESDFTFSSSSRFFLQSVLTSSLLA